MHATAPCHPHTPRGKLSLAKVCLCRWLEAGAAKKLGVSRQADLVRLALSAAELPGSGR